MNLNNYNIFASKLSTFEWEITVDGVNYENKYIYKPHTGYGTESAAIKGWLQEEFLKCAPIRNYPDFVTYKQHNSNANEDNFIRLKTFYDEMSETLGRKSVEHLMDDLLVLGKIDEGIVRRLEEMDISVSTPTPQSGEYVADIEFYSPAGEDVCFSIWFDGTTEGFVSSLEEFADSFDPDEHSEAHILNRGQNGTPSSIKVLVNDAEWIGQNLKDAVTALQGLDDDASHSPQI